MKGENGLGYSVGCTMALCARVSIRRVCYSFLSSTPATAMPPIASHAFASQQHETPASGSTAWRTYIRSFCRITLARSFPPTCTEHPAADPKKVDSHTFNMCSSVVFPALSRPRKSNFYHASTSEPRWHSRPSPNLTPNPVARVP